MSAVTQGLDTLITGGHLLTMAGAGVGFVEDGAVAIEGAGSSRWGRAPRSRRTAPRPRRSTRGTAGHAGADRRAHALGGGAGARLGAGGRDVDGAAYGPMLRNADPADAPLGTLWALMEGVANGTTTFGDYTRPMDDLVKSHALMGNRGVVCDSISELNFANREQWIARGWKPGDPTPLDPEAGQASLERSLRLLREVGRPRRRPHPGDLRPARRGLPLQGDAAARAGGGAQARLPDAPARGPGPAREQRHAAALRPPRHPLPRLDRAAGAGPDRRAPLHRDGGRGRDGGAERARAWSAAPTRSASSTA